MPEPAELPFINSADYLRFHRVFRHIPEGFHILAPAVEDFRKKTLSPHVPGGVMLPVPSHGEDAQYPLHDERQGFALPGAYDEMDVVTHNAKIMDLEAILLFRPADGGKEKGLHGLTIEDHFLSVCPGGDVIHGAGLEHSVSPHIRVYGAKVKNALVDLGFLAKYAKFHVFFVIFKLCPQRRPSEDHDRARSPELCPQRQPAEDHDRAPFPELCPR
jgi:hypothetical protein